MIKYSTISKSRFKARALEYFRQVERTGRELIITDRGKPVLKLVPFTEDPQQALRVLREAGVSLLAYSAFPIGGRRAQMDFIPENMSAFKKVARKNGWRLSKVKKGFLITGQERLGAVHRHFAKLSDAKINVTAVMFSGMKSI